MTNSRASKVVYWGLVVLGLAAFAGYLFYRLADQQSRYSILDSFLATMFGVLVGVPVALAIDRRKQREDEHKIRKRKETERTKRLDVLVDRIKLELDHNVETVVKLKEALSSSRKSRIDLWEWAISIVESLSLESTGEYNRSELRQDMPPGLDDALFHSNYDLRRLINCVRQAAKKHSFLYGHSADVEGAKRMLEELREANENAGSLLRDTLRSLEEWMSAT